MYLLILSRPQPANDELPVWLRDQLATNPSVAPATSPRATRAATSSAEPKPFQPRPRTPEAVGGLDADELPPWLRQHARERVAAGLDPLPPAASNPQPRTGQLRPRTPEAVGDLDADELPPWLRQHARERVAAGLDPLPPASAAEPATLTLGSTPQSAVNWPASASASAAPAHQHGIPDGLEDRPAGETTADEVRGPLQPQSTEAAAEARLAALRKKEASVRPSHAALEAQLAALRGGGAPSRAPPSLGELQQRLDQLRYGSKETTQCLDQHRKSNEHRCQRMG